MYKRLYPLSHLPSSKSLLSFMGFIFLKTYFTIKIGSQNVGSVYIFCCVGPADNTGSPGWTNSTAITQQVCILSQGGNRVFKDLHSLISRQTSPGHVSIPTHCAVQKTMGKTQVCHNGWVLVSKHDIKGRHRSSQISSLHLEIHEYKVSFSFLFISQGFLLVFKTGSLCHPG